MASSRGHSRAGIEGLPASKAIFDVEPLDLLRQQAHQVGHSIMAFLSGPCVCQAGQEIASAGSPRAVDKFTASSRSKRGG